MKRISKRVREEAALICSAAASVAPDQWGVRCSDVHYSRIQDGLGFDRASYELAMAVWNRLCGWRPLVPWTPEVDAEAEALLRTGWSPS